MTDLRVECLRSVCGGQQSSRQTCQSPSYTIRSGRYLEPDVKHGVDDVIKSRRASHNTPRCHVNICARGLTTACIAGQTGSQPENHLNTSRDGATDVAASRGASDRGERVHRHAHRAATVEDTPLPGARLSERPDQLDEGGCVDGAGRSQQEFPAGAGQGGVARWSVVDPRRGRMYVRHPHCVSFPRPERTRGRGHQNGSRGNAERVEGLSHGDVRPTSRHDQHDSGGERAVGAGPTPGGERERLGDSGTPDVVRQE